LSTPSVSAPWCWSDSCVRAETPRSVATKGVTRAGLIIASFLPVIFLVLACRRFYSWL
jgi:hypothetical protein